MSVLGRMRGASPLVRYTSAVALVVATLVVTAVVERYTDRVPSAPLFAAVLAVAWIDGFGAAIASTAVAAVALDYLYQGRRSFLDVSEREFVWLMLFVAMTVCAAWLAARVTRLVDQRAALLERERDARRDAEAANRAKDDFVAIVSHELRTPLSAILTWTLALKEPAATAAQRSNALDVIARNARTLAALIDELLDISRIIAGKLTLELRPLDLVPVARVSVESLRPMAAARGLSLAFAADVHTAPVLGDAIRLQQVVTNLLSNAIKFTPPGGRVDASVSLHGFAVSLTVRDTGVGIDSEMLPHVFERFHQEPSDAARHGGLGLGLAIVQQLVERHGGTVRADSRGRGHGATFTVELPVHRALPDESLFTADSSLSHRPSLSFPVERR